MYSPVEDVCNNMNWMLDAKAKPRKSYYGTTKEKEPFIPYPVVYQSRFSSKSSTVGDCVCVCIYVCVCVCVSVYPRKERFAFYFKELSHTLWGLKF